MRSPPRARCGLRPAVRRVALCHLALASSLLACGRARSAAPANLLLVVSDSLRADILSCYGGPARTPEICGLAERGTLFESARSAAPWTLPAVVALAGGSYPTVYARGVGQQGRIRIRIPDSELLLAEALAASGYDASAYLENPLAGQGNGWQGMRRQGQRARRREAPEDPLLARLGVDLESRAYRKLTGPLQYLAQPSEKPFFLLVWIDDPHAPYRPPARHLAALQPAAAALPRPLDYYLGLGHIHAPDRGERRLRAELPGLSAGEIEFLRRLYITEVEAVDERVGYLLRALELSGRRDSTYVVFTADHGEGFGEHGSFLHGETLYEEAVRVPLIVAGPGLPRGARRGEAVSLVDLMPTFADLLAMACLEDPQGRSLRSLLGARDAGGWERRPTYLANPLRDRELEAVVRGRHKLIRDGDRFALYDLAADPGEQQDLGSVQPALRDELRAELERLRGATLRLQAARLKTAGPTPDADAETLRQLRALGYLD